MLLWGYPMPPLDAGPCPRFFPKRNLCYSVCVANTSEHISIRLPAQLVAELRAQAEAEDRSLAWVIARRLEGGEAGNSSMQVASVRSNRKPVRLRKSADNTTLAERRDAGPQEGYMQGMPESRSQSCPECGALRGHQKWCKKR